MYNTNSLYQPLLLPPLYTIYQMQGTSKNIKIARSVTGKNYTIIKFDKNTLKSFSPKIIFPKFFMSFRDTFSENKSLLKFYLLYFDHQ